MHMFMRRVLIYTAVVLGCLAAYSYFVAAEHVLGHSARQELITVSGNQRANIASLTADATSQPPHANVIQVHPGGNIQYLVDQYGGNTTFLLKTGIHRLQQIVPKSRHTFVGENGTILSGARLLTEFVKEGKYWTVIGQTQQGGATGRCEHIHVAMPVDTCMFPEDLFIDDIPLTQVSQLTDLSPTKWYFDYESDKIYLMDDPHGHKVETSVTPYAFEGNASNVVIRGLVIEKYATPTQEGAIHGRMGHSGPLGKNWLIENNEIRFNHAMGIRVGDGSQVMNNRIHHNGQYGVGGNGTDIVIANNEISYNNSMGYHWHTGGGTKFVWTKNLIVRHNHVHHNFGPGLWTDINNINTLYENNTVRLNRSTGIFHEISYSAVIRNNVVEENGFDNSVWLNGAGILVSCSSEVEVYGNTVRHNADGIGAIQTERGHGRYGYYEVKNLHVHHNNIVMKEGETGFDVKTRDLQYYTKKNNRFTNNTYIVESQEPKSFRWMNARHTFKEWQNFGQDVSGTMTKTTKEPVQLPNSPVN